VWRAIRKGYLGGDVGILEEGGRSAGHELDELLGQGAGHPLVVGQPHGALQDLTHHQPLGLLLVHLEDVRPET
jgi:hypothetical protein